VAVGGWTPPGEYTEPPGVVEADANSTFNHDINVVMGARGIVGIANSQRTGHPQVDQQTAWFQRGWRPRSVQFDQKVFCPSPAAEHEASAGLVDLHRYGPPETGVTDHDFPDPVSGQERFDTPKSGFNFR